MSSDQTRSLGFQGPSVPVFFFVRVGQSRLAWAATLAVVCGLTGCASRPGGLQAPPRAAVPPPPSLHPDTDGPPQSAPADLAAVPDAQPKVEPIREGGPNKPYTVQGERYAPQTTDVPWHERGQASWYGRKFHGQRTASGELYNMYGMTAAHRTLPIPSYARVRNPANGKEVIVRVNDRGPFHRDRVIDLSYTAAVKLGLLERGSVPVEIERLTFEDIRTGAWQRNAPTALAAATLPDVASTAVPGHVTPDSDRAAVPLPAGPVDPAVLLADPSVPALPAAAPADTTVSDAGAAAAASPASAAVPVLSSGPPARAYTLPARGFWVQVGAFTRRQGAEDFQRKLAQQLEQLSPLMAVFNEAATYRLQIGPYPSRSEARGAAQRIREALQLAPLIVERR